MRKFFRSSSSSAKKPEGKPATGVAEGKDEKQQLPPPELKKLDKKELKEKKKKEKAAPLVLTSRAAGVVSQNILFNAPQLSRPGEAESMAEALAAEVVADNADAGIPLLLTTVPTLVDMSKAPENLRRGSVLKYHGRGNSISSDGSQHSPTSGLPPSHLFLTSPPLSPTPMTVRSNSVASRSSRPKVHFDVSDKMILEAQTYSHQQRFTIASGNFLHFERPPTTHYKFATTTESIHTKGTLLQLVTSASSDDEKNTWDSVTPVPLYAARYHSPLVMLSDRTIYWEIEIKSLGFSKFSSLDHPNTSKSSKKADTAAKPTQPQTTSTEDEGLPDLGLARSVSHTHAPVSDRMAGSAIAIGFVVKSVTPDTVPFLRRKSSLRPVDEFPFPASVAGDGIFWSSDHGGSIYIEGNHTRHTVKAGVGDTVGVGLTFKLDPSQVPKPTEDPEITTPPTTPPPTSTAHRKDSKELSRRKSSASSMTDAPSLEPSELRKVPVEWFIVVNGEKKATFVYPDDSKNPFDLPIPDYMLGKYDVYPCICIQGAGVECKTRMGQAVSWQGEGGAPDIKSRSDARVNPAAIKPPKWWSHISSHAH